MAGRPICLTARPSRAGCLMEAPAALFGPDAIALRLWVAVNWDRLAIRIALLVPPRRRRRQGS